MMNVVQLNKIRTEGNVLFSKRKYSKAIQVYSRCITECVRTIESRSSSSSSLGVEYCEEGEIRNTLLLAWSNKSEANLKLKRYDDALGNAEKALELNANDGKSLNRKARAFEGLQRFEEANLAFLACLKQAPQDKDIRESLVRTKICTLQSQKGDYNLSSFYLGGLKGPFEPCCEYVGSVEIRKASSGGRGLFATRHVEAGELLFVSKALAIAPACEESRIGFQLCQLAAMSARHRYQLQTLACTDSQEGLEIPSMELFIPGSKWLPSKVEDVVEELDWQRVSGILYFNSFKLHGSTADASEFYDPHPPRRTGVWGLPSFLNHSCSPNTLRMHVGDAMFVRAAEAISSGEELTMSYIDNSDVIQNRQKTCHTWGFQCSCPRCLFEQSFKPLQKMSKIFYDLVQATNAGTFRGPMSSYMASHYQGLEKIIQSAPNLTSQQKNWIRASCTYAYMGKTTMVQDDLQQKIAVLDQMVDAELQVSSGGITAFQHSCALLRDVGRLHGKRSNEYFKTEQRVLDIFGVAYGTHDRKVLLFLIEKIMHFESLS